MAKDNNLQDLQKAADVVGELLKCYTQDTTEERDRILAQDTMGKLFQNPAAALLEEEAIQNAPQSILCLAAFVAEFASGVTEALRVLSEKVDVIAKNNLTVAKDTIDAVSDAVEIIKASAGGPMSGAFVSAPAVGHHDPTNLSKATKEYPPKDYIVDKLEEFAKNGKCSMYVVSQYENTGKLPKDLEEAILASWKSNQIL